MKITGKTPKGPSISPCGESSSFQDSDSLDNDLLQEQVVTYIYIYNDEIGQIRMIPNPELNISAQ